MRGDDVVVDFDSNDVPYYARSPARSRTRGRGGRRRLCFGSRARFGSRADSARTRERAVGTVGETDDEDGEG